MLHPHALALPDRLRTTDGYPLPMLARLAVRFAVVVTQWDMNYRTRRHLKDLSDHQLRDIGIERDVACTEAARPFWR